MEWIEIKGSLGEQMLRYSLALSRHARGVEVGVEGQLQPLHKLFPALPQLPGRQAGIAGRLRSLIAPAGVPAGDAPWLSHEVVESLGDAAGDYFTLAPEAVPACFAGIAAKLQGENTVAVHVLRPGKDSCTCTPDYYNWAIAGMSQWLGDVRLVVITDNLSLTRRCLHTGDVPVEWVELPRQHHRLIFHLLRQARHCIACDSMESWWGAWLNADPDKIVVVPKTLPAALIPYYWTAVPVT